MNIKTSLCKDIHRMHVFVALESPKESDLLLDPPSSLNCANLGRNKLNDYVLNNTHLHHCKDVDIQKYVIPSEVHTQNCANLLT